MSRTGRRESGRALSGLRIAVTRPAGDGGELAHLLEQAGAVPIILPLTTIVTPADDAALRGSVERLDDYDWLVFTSANAVRALAAAGAARDARPRIAAVGAATAAAVHALTGRDPDVVPHEFSSAALAAAMLINGPLHGARVLWPRAEVPREDLRSALRSAGAMVDDPVAYCTVRNPHAAAELAALTTAGQIDVITFTAPSAVEAFAEALSGPVRCRIAVIGPATAAAARARGLSVHVEAEQHIISALVNALAQFHTRGSH